nr:MAG TPA: large terminase [Caudoviricetes sp.]
MKSHIIQRKARMPRSMVYQARYLEDESDNVLVEKGRQEGFSEYSAIKATRASVKAGALFDWWVCSRDLAAAKLFIDDCKKWADFYNLGAGKLGKEIIEGETVFSITFSTGRTIHALSSNPDVLAGKRGNVILDEFALHKDQQKLLKVSSAVTQWGGQRIVISTHRGKGSVFAQLVNDCVNNGNPMRWSHHRVTIQDAVDAGIVERINAKTGKKMTREDFLASCRAKCLTEADFLEEYMCVPQDTAGQLVSWDTINACTNDRYATAAGNIAAEEGEFGVGVDVARLSDKHCYIALKPWHDRYVVRLVYYHEDNSWESRDRKLDEMTGAAGVKLVVIDQTGLGDKYVEDAKKRRNGHKVRGILFTNGSKEELASNLARALEAGKIIIPSHDLLKAHIAAIEKGYTKTGLVCYSADRTESGHADLFWALAMAYHALTLKASDGVWTRERAEGVVMGSSRGRYRHQRRILTRTRK